ncbi:MAG: hypothetical protein ACJ8R9_20220 [Steroidobacteraceae bacterium]
MYSMAGQLARIALLVVLALKLPGQVVAATTLEAGQKVVFVCEHGSVKSLIAASYFNRSAQAHGLLYHAIARGTAPEPRVPLSVQKGLHAIEVDVSSYVPQLFQASDVEGASLVVSFDQDIDGLVGGKVRHLKWDRLPAVLTNYPRGRDAIVAQIDSLIAALAQGRRP